MRILLAAVLAFVLGLGTAFLVLSRTGVPVAADETAIPGSARSAWSQFAMRMGALGDRIQGSDFPKNQPEPSADPSVQ